MDFGLNMLILLSFELSVIGLSQLEFFKYELNND